MRVEYGSRVGAWRVLRLFKEFNWNFTTYAIAMAMEKNPSFAKACVREGHEIAAHGWRWLDLWDMTVEEDAENIVKACTSLEKSTGEFPVGVYFGRGTPNTKGLFSDVFKKMGKPLLYCSEAYNDDVPYWIDLPAEKDLPDNEKEGMLIVPYNYDCNGNNSFPFHTPFQVLNHSANIGQKMESFTCRPALLAQTCMRTTSRQHLTCCTAKDATVCQR